jgi:hypothetical protein
MSDIHELVARLGAEEARARPPADLLAGLDPRRRRADAREAQRRLQDWQRRVLWAAETLASAEGLRRNWLHSGFCLVALPHTKPAEHGRPHSLKNGAFKLILTPKPLDTDDEGNPVYAGLPYGSKARLIMVYIQTYAVKHRTRHVVLGDSMTSWIRKLGFDNVSGGERGVINAINEQAKRISRTEFTMIFEQGNSRVLRDQALVKGLELFAERAPHQLDLLGGPEAAQQRPQRRPRRYSWVREIELAEDFYEHLTEHRVVLAEEAIAKLKGSSWALDAYLWLCYRLRSVEDETPPISWQQLRQQFAPNLYKGNINVFRTRVMEPALRDVQAVYPEARIVITDKGVVLRPSAPPVPASLTQARLPAPV